MRNHSRAVAPLAALVIAAACGTTDAPGPLEPTGPTGRIRFVNLITDTTRGRVNAILEGVPFGVNLTYTQSTPATLPAPSTANYAAVYSGGRSLVLKRTIDTSVVVASLDVSIATGEDRTVYAVGGAGGSAVAAYSTSDVNSTVPATQTRLRAVQLSPTAGAVDIFVTAPNADLATATPTFANLAYQVASAYVPVAPGTYQIRAVPAGTPAASRAATVTIVLPSTALAGATGRTVVTADNNVGGSPLRAFVLGDQ